MDWNIPVIEPGELKELLNRESVLLVDVQRNRAAYEAEHLPGAVNFFLYEYFITDTRESQLEGAVQELGEMFRAQGVTRDVPVVFCDAETGTVAPRTCFFLHLIGHPRTAVLNGGLRDWKGIGGQVEKGAVKPTPAARFRPRLNREAIATVDDVVAGITRNDTIVLDVRSNDEYEGRLNDASGCEECDRLGHIPGSVWVEFSELTEGRYRIKPWQEVQARLAQAGVTPDKTLIPY